MTADEIESLRRLFEVFCTKQEFILNPDKAHVDFLLKGLLDFKKELGLMYCPCRLRTGDFEKDLELVCPCNFFIQETWTKQNRCWCGLFVRK